MSGDERSQRRCVWYRHLEGRGLAVGAGRRQDMGRTRSGLWRANQPALMPSESRLLMPSSFSSTPSESFARLHKALDYSNNGPVES